MEAGRAAGANVPIMHAREALWSGFPTSAFVATYIILASSATVVIALSGFAADGFTVANIIGMALLGFGSVIPIAIVHIVVLVRRRTRFLRTKE